MLSLQTQHYLTINHMPGCSHFYMCTMNTIKDISMQVSG
uniref:Uncharacterized protein n=1 Tax=Arundo donax TaxID=35708 RepID=A0A0A9BJX5_ARUDO